MNFPNCPSTLSPQVECSQCCIAKPGSSATKLHKPTHPASQCPPPTSNAITISSPLFHSPNNPPIPNKFSSLGRKKSLPRQGKGVEKYKRPKNTKEKPNILGSKDSSVSKNRDEDEWKLMLIPVKRYRMWRAHKVTHSPFYIYNHFLSFIMAIRLLSWNCHGYRSHLDDIKSLVNSVHPICIGLQETMLSPPIPTKLKQYHILRKDNIHNSRPVGGVALLYSESFPSRNLD
ncbi:hypothetical protein CDAR_124761 [Caerostris darwini]|uniref:Uncharacterized protein n=1 Tax=Caerostris darwini TaxID=1538125 RepID=A0AAV4W172_9ARAC|nr:hypothetical protein CDAR_124761 [Caerostris darwini]